MKSEQCVICFEENGILESVTVISQVKSSNLGYHPQGWPTCELKVMSSVDSI